MDEDFEAELYEQELTDKPGPPGAPPNPPPRWAPPGYIPGEVEAMDEMQANRQPPFNTGPAKEAQYRDYPPPAVPPGYDNWEDFMVATRRNAEYVALVHGPGGVNEVAAAIRRMHPDPTKLATAITEDFSDVNQESRMGWQPLTRPVNAELRSEIRKHLPGPFTLEQERWLADIPPEDAARADHLHAATLRIYEEIAWSNWADKQMRSEDA